jgi:hypothetical protein
VLPILLVDFVHLPISIHYEDARNLPLVVLVTQLKEVFLKHIIVFSKPNDFVQVWWILNLLLGSDGTWISFAMHLQEGRR